jgi:hypothetical protein
VGKKDAKGHIASEVVSDFPFMEGLTACSSFFIFFFLSFFPI